MKKFLVRILLFNLKNMKWVEFKLVDKKNDILAIFSLEKWHPDLVNIIKYIDVYILSASFFAYYTFSHNKDSEYFWLSFYDILQNFIKWYSSNKNEAIPILKEMDWKNIVHEHWFRMEINEIEFRSKKEKMH